MRIFASLLVSIGAVIAGCAPAEERIDPNLHRPDIGTGNMPAYGSLTVSSTKQAAEKLAGQGEHEVMPEVFFSVYDSNGRMVANSGAEEIQLPPGRYLVRTEDDQDKEKEFWVTVEAGKATEVDARRLGESKGAMPVE
jgi:hypothetical protein